MWILLIDRGSSQREKGNNLSSLPHTMPLFLGLSEVTLLLMILRFDSSFFNSPSPLMSLGCEHYSFVYPDTNLYKCFTGLYNFCVALKHCRTWLWEQSVVIYAHKRWRAVTKHPYTANNTRWPLKDVFTEARGECWIHRLFLLLARPQKTRHQCQNWQEMCLFREFSWMSVGKNALEWVAST